MIKEFDINSTTNRRVNITQLRAELASLLNYSHCVLMPKKVEVHFTDTTDDSAYNLVVSNHQGLSAPTYRLRNFCRSNAMNKPINEVDYTSVKEIDRHLQRKDYFTAGRLVKVEYYETYNLATDTGTNLVIRVEVNYVDTPDNSFTLYRETKRTWILEDGTDGVQTTSYKYYSNIQSVDEAVTRRKNIIKVLKVNVPGLIMATEQVDVLTAQQMGVPLFVIYGAGLKAYEEAKAMDFVNTDLPAAALLTGFEWLNNDIGGGVSIKDYITNEMTY